MNVSIFFTRVFFSVLSIVFMTVYSLSVFDQQGLWIGLISGLALTGILIGFDLIFRRSNLRSFNVVIIGLFIGYLMGQALVLVLTAVLDFTLITSRLETETIEVIKIALFLFGLYLGTLMTLRASDQLYVSIPFFKFSPTSQLKKDVVADMSVLADPRLIDICATHLFDHHLVIPRFLVKELVALAETGEEQAQTQAKNSLEVVKKLEAMHALHLRYSDTDFPETSNIFEKLLRLSRLLDGHLLTSSVERAQTATVEGVHLINLHTLSNALKPLLETGHHMDIKIQRPGKEPRQGVGYLDDGAMVVVNGGGDYIGETIEVQVLSVKHTSSGRIIFCNALDEEEYEE